MPVRPAAVRSALALGALAAGSLAAVPPAAAAAAPGCADGARIAAAALPTAWGAGCDAGVTIVDGAAAAVLPARGASVTASVLTVGGERTLTVSRDTAGRTSVRTSLAATGATPRSAAAPAAPASACSSSAYDLLGYRVRGAYRWSYNGAGAPASVRAAAAAALNRATRNVTSGHNDCGLREKPKVNARYLGATTKQPGVAAGATCSVNDGRSVTGWKRLTANGVLAVTCTYYNTGTGVVSASDAAINTRYTWTTKAAGCKGAYDLQGVMTHERGHTFGLGHVTADSALTMYPSVSTCNFTKSTLGRGDLLGLISIYGAA